MTRRRPVNFTELPFPEEPTGRYSRGAVEALLLAARRSSAKMRAAVEHMEEAFARAEVRS